jgi:CBS domain-containing protein
MRGPQVRDVMTKLVVKLYPKDSIRDAAMRLAQNNISGAPVVQEKLIVGIVSEADLLRAAAPADPDRRRATVLGIVPVWGRAAATVQDEITSVGEIMTKEVVTVSPEASVWDAAGLMERHGVKRLPVAGPDKELVGVISRGDIVRVMAREDDVLQDDVVAALATLGSECTSNIQVQVQDGIATLRGRADRRSTKEIALRLAALVVGVAQVVDSLGFDDDDGHVEPHKTEGDPWAVGPLVKLG